MVIEPKNNLNNYYSINYKAGYRIYIKTPFFKLVLKKLKTKMDK